MSKDKPRKQRSPHGKMVTGIILLGIGVLFLLNNFDILFIDESWPLILVVVGVALLVGAWIRKHDEESAATPPVL